MLRHGRKPDRGLLVHSRIQLFLSNRYGSFASGILQNLLCNQTSNGRQHGKVIRPLHNIAVNVLIFRSSLDIFEIDRISLASLYEKSGILHIVQPVDRRTHDKLLLVFRVEGKLAVIVILHLIHCAEAENGTEFIAVFCGKKRPGTARTVPAKINPVRVHIGERGRIFVSGYNIVHLAEKSLVIPRVIAASPEGRIHGKNAVLPEGGACLIIVPLGIAPGKIVNAVSPAAYHPDYHGMLLPVLRIRGHVSRQIPHL